MGVPVLTLAGNTMVSRMSASMLTSVGLRDWIATSPAEFVSRAVEHANAWRALPPAEKLARRNTLRALAAGSPLFDSHDLAHALENAFEAMIAQRASVGAGR